MLQIYKNITTLLLLNSLILLIACTPTTLEPSNSSTEIEVTRVSTIVDVTRENELIEPTLAPTPTEILKCSPATVGDLAGIDPRNQTIQWWHNHRGSREEIITQMVERYNAENECGITVEAKAQGGYTDIRQAVNAAIANGEKPATLIVGYQTDQAFYQFNQTLVDLNIYINDPHWGLTQEEKADFVSDFLHQGSHQSFANQQLGYPAQRSMEVIYYNQTWLQELGYDTPPTTPEQFREMACAGAETNNNGTGGYILRDDASAIAAWTFAFGGNILNETGDSYIYDSSATIEAMTFLKELYDDGCAYFIDNMFPNPEVAQRQALFAQGSSSGIPFYQDSFQTVAQETNKELDQLGVIAIPHTAQNPVQNIYGADIMITQTTPKAQLAAWHFLNWFTQPENQAQWVRATNYFPVRLSTFDFLEDYMAENPVWAQTSELLLYSQHEPNFASYTTVRDLATNAFRQIMDDTDIQQTLADLTETSNFLEQDIKNEIEPSE